MNFVSFEMPASVDSNGLSSETARVLSIYSQIDASGFHDLNSPEHQDQLLGDFVDRETYVATDDEGQIQGVSLYIPGDTPYGWIEGLAVHPDSRKTDTQPSRRVGSYLVQNMVALARLDGKTGLQLMSTKSAFNFWLKQGFRYGGSPEISNDLGMSLEL